MFMFHYKYERVTRQNKHGYNPRKPPQSIKIEGRGSRYALAAKKKPIVETMGFSKVTAVLNLSMMVAIRWPGSATATAMSASTSRRPAAATAARWSWRF